jgi:hypothetical protein
MLKEEEKMYLNEQNEITKKLNLLLTALKGATLVN